MPLANNISKDCIRTNSVIRYCHAAIAETIPKDGVKKFTFSIKLNFS